MRNYHRVLNRLGNSVLVKKNDDLLSACMKARMMKRYARPVPLGYSPYRVRNARANLGPVRFSLLTGRPFPEDLRR
jgi:hypothetical protein